MAETSCIRCGQAKYEAHGLDVPHASLPTAARCTGYANVLNADGEPTFEPGGGSGGGGGASGSW